MSTPNAKQLVAELPEQGWSVRRTNGGHYQCAAPDGVNMVTLSDSGDPRALKNNLALLRRAGFLWPPPPKQRGPQARPSVDALYEALKRTRESVELEERRLTPLRAAVQTAEELLADARKELATGETNVRRAREELAEAKLAFDAAFGGGA